MSTAVVRLVCNEVHYCSSNMILKTFKTNTYDRSYIPFECTLHKLHTNRGVGACSKPKQQHHHSRMRVLCVASVSTTFTHLEALSLFSSRSRMHGIPMPSCSKATIGDAPRAARPDPLLSSSTALFLPSRPKTTNLWVGIRWHAAMKAKVHSQISWWSGEAGAQLHAARRRRYNFLHEECLLVSVPHGECGLDRTHGSSRV